MITSPEKCGHKVNQSYDLHVWGGIHGALSIKLLVIQHRNISQYLLGESTQLNEQQKNGSLSQRMMMLSLDIIITRLARKINLAERQNVTLNHILS